MLYADTDFFFALMKENDRLNPAAVRAYERYKGQLSASMATVIELLIVGKRAGYNATRLVQNVVLIAAIEGISQDNLLLVARYIDDYGMSIFDSFHAVLCNGEILSSDHTYDAIGIQRIGLMD